MTPDQPTLGGRLMGWPPFIRELDATLSVHSQYVLSGNLHDSFLVPGADELRPAQLLPLRDVLWDSLRASGFSALFMYDPVDGLRVYPGGEDGLASEGAEAAAKLLGRREPDEKPSLEALAQHLSAVARPVDNVSAAFIIYYASRIPRSPADRDRQEGCFFRLWERVARTAGRVGVEGPRPKPLYNPVIWLVERPGYLPP